MFSMLFEGKNVQIKLEKIETLDASELKIRYPDKYLIFQLLYSEGEQNGYVFLNKKDAKVIFNLIMGKGIEEEVELSPEEISVFSETFSHIVDSWKSFFEKLKVKVNFEKAEFSTLEKIDGELILSQLKMTVEDLFSADILQVFPEELVKKISFKEEKPPAEKKEVKEEQKIRPVRFSPLEEKPLSKELGNIDLILDVPLQITVELGRAKMSIKEVLELSTGRVIELDKLDGEPVDILANGRLIARGEVVVIGETFGVRVTDILTPEERLGKIRD